MKQTSSFVRTMMLASVALGGGSLGGQLNAATIDPAVEYTTSSTENDSRAFTVGYEFSTSVPFVVNALGYWVDGNANNHQVGIWDSVGTLLTSTTVLSGDPIQGHFQWRAIPDLTLPAGTYTIGGEYLGNNDPFCYIPASVLTIAGYTWITDRQLGGAGLNYPTVETHGEYGNNGILMADFSVQGVPDAGSTLVLLGGAFALMGALARRFRE